MHDWLQRGERSVCRDRPSERCTQGACPLSSIPACMVCGLFASDLDASALLPEDNRQSQRIVPDPACVQVSCIDIMHCLLFSLFAKAKLDDGTSCRCGSTGCRWCCTSAARSSGRWWRMRQACSSMWKVIYILLLVARFRASVAFVKVLQFMIWFPTAGAHVVRRGPSACGFCRAGETQFVLRMWHIGLSIRRTSSKCSPCLLAVRETVGVVSGRQ